MTPLLIKCWTVLRHRSHIHHHIRRVGRHLAAHKAVAVATPIIVCSAVGGWFYPPAPAPAAFSSAPIIASPAIPLEIGPAFFGAGFSPAPGSVLTPSEFSPFAVPAEFSPSAFSPSVRPSEFSPSTVPGEFSPITPISAPIPSEQVPEPASLALFSIGIAALYFIKRARA